MNKTYGIIVVVLILVATIFGIGVLKFKLDVNHKSFDLSIGGAANELDATYHINGKAITLKNGSSELTDDSGSANSKIITWYFGNEVKHDFNGDGRIDVAFILTQQMGGSGTFYYVVAALNTINGYIGSDAVFLGDRIAPQSTHMGNGNVFVVNYATRNPGEPFTTRPSLGKSIWLLLDPKSMTLGEVAQNFEGEADPARMKLDMKAWNWVSTTYNDDTKIMPKDSTKFSLTLKTDGTFSSKTDCNTIGGKYTISGNQKIAFNQMVSTLMYCDGSQEHDYANMLGQVGAYHFTSRGQLIFDLKMDSGTSVFR